MANGARILPTCVGRLYFLQYNRNPTILRPLLAPDLPHLSDNSQLTGLSNHLSIWRRSLRISASVSTTGMAWIFSGKCSAEDLYSTNY